MWWLTPAHDMCYVTISKYVFTKQIFVYFKNTCVCLSQKRFFVSLKFKFFGVFCHSGSIYLGSIKVLHRWNTTVKELSAKKTVPTCWYIYSLWNACIYKGSSSEALEHLKNKYIVHKHLGNRSAGKKRGPLSRCCFHHKNYLRTTRL